MKTRLPRYTKEEHARRGKELYEHNIRPNVEPTCDGQIVAIDVDTGDYEVAEDTLRASKQLLARRPDAQVWCVRAGQGAVHRFGFHVKQEA